MFRFATPYALLLIILIPLVAAYRRRHPAPALGHSGVDPVGDLPPSAGLRVHRLLPLLFYLVLLLLITALARPQYGTERATVSETGINIILAVDLSESMAALDFKQEGRIVNRLEAVKRVVNDFIARRDGDRIGLVVFGSQAYTQLPLTRDYQTIAAMLDRLEIGAAGRATAVGDAIGISIKRLADIESRTHIIILLTDGRSNSGELMPQTAADIARQKEIKIYTIGVGGEGRAPFLVDDPIFGQRYVYQNVDLDEETLVQIADATGGAYFRAQDTAALEKIYATIDALEKSEAKVARFAEHNELYRYLLVPALALLALWIVLKNTRYLDIP